MAILKPGVLGEASGRLGAVEFAHVGGRSVVKKAKCGQSRTSVFRARAQACQTAAIAHWHLLTDAQRGAWEQAAVQRLKPDRFGVKRPMNGFQLFLTIPHDFTYTTTWDFFDVPPVYSLPPLSDKTVEIVAGTSFEVFKLMVLWPLACIVWVKVARFRPESNRRAYTWRKIGPIQGNNDVVLDFQSVLDDDGILFLVNERVRVVLGTCEPGYWPVEYDYGNVTVTAP